MIVTLDGERLTGSLHADCTLQALIDRIRETHLGNRLVVAVAIDGQPLLGQELSDRLDSPPGEVSQVDLTSADRWQLVADGLREIAERLGKAADEQTVIADELHAGNVSAAVNRFGQFMQEWQTCQRAIAECSGLLGRDLTAVECVGRPVREHLDGLASKLRELRDAFEARDMVLVADLIQFEMPDMCQAWQDILNELAREVAAQASPSSSGAPAS